MSALVPALPVRSSPPPYLFPQSVPEEFRSDWVGGAGGGAGGGHDEGEAEYVGCCSYPPSRWRQSRPTPETIIVFEPVPTPTPTPEESLEAEDPATISTPLCDAPDQPWQPGPAQAMAQAGKPWLQPAPPPCPAPPPRLAPSSRSPPSPQIYKYKRCLLSRYTADLDMENKILKESLQQWDGGGRENSQERREENSWKGREGEVSTVFSAEERLREISRTIELGRPDWTELPASLNSFCSSSVNPSSTCSSSSSREGGGESSDVGAQEILDTVISSAVQASEAKVRKIINIYTIGVF